jgi:hypothetical protein
MQQPKSSEKAFREVLEKTPDNTVAQLGLVKSLLIQGRATECQGLLRNFPASREYSNAEIIRPLTDALVRLEYGNLTASCSNVAIFQPHLMVYLTFYVRTSVTEKVKSDA